MEKQLKQLMTELQGFRSEVTKRFDGVDERFEGVDKQFAGVNQRFDRLEQGQDDILKMLKHNTTLLTENFTGIRKDLRIKTQDTQADDDHIYNEVDDLKRRTDKIEQNMNE